MFGLGFNGGKRCTYKKRRISNGKKSTLRLSRFLLDLPYDVCRIIMMYIHLNDCCAILRLSKAHYRHFKLLCITPRPALPVLGLVKVVYDCTPCHKRIHRQTNALFLAMCTVVSSHIVPVHKTHFNARTGMPRDGTVKGPWMQQTHSERPWRPLIRLDFRCPHVFVSGAQCEGQLRLIRKQKNK